MAGFFGKPQWSTLTLLGVGVAFCWAGYRAGLGARGLAPGIQTNVSAPPARAPLPVAAREESATRRRESGATARPPARAKKFLATIEEIAATDQARAFALAAAEPNWRLRTLLRNAALRGWASVAPAEAAAFALTLPDHERRDAVAALFLGASNHPESAARVAANLCAQDPGLAEDHGRALIDALAEVGAFSVLARFAASDASGHSGDWLSATFGKWAEQQPAAAQLALDSLPTPAARQAAFQGLVLGWSMAEPRELANYAAGLPAGENRSLAMQQALAQWMTHEPEAVAKWVMHFDPGPEFDLSAATVATTPRLVMQQPAVALGWAQSILEPALRESTLTMLARQWAGRDRASAQRLIEQAAGLSPEDRSVLLAGLDTLPQKEQ